MTSKLPPNLLALFAPRPPIRYLPPTEADRALDDVHPSKIGGIAQYLPELKKYEEEVPYEPTDSWLQRKMRQKVEKKEKLQEHLTKGLEECMGCRLIAVCVSCRADLSGQTIHPRIRRFEETRSKRCLCPALATMSRSPISNASLAALVPLKEYVGCPLHLARVMLTFVRSESSRTRTARTRRSRTRDTLSSCMSAKRI